MISIDSTLAAPAETETITDVFRSSSKTKVLVMYGYSGNRPPADKGTTVLPSSLRALGLSDAWPHEIDGIRVVETQISWIILTGDRAYKIKKAVNLGFLDYSALADRKHYCEEELSVNRRYAGDVYDRVVPISEVGGMLRVDNEQIRGRIRASNATVSR